MIDLFNSLDFKIQAAIIAAITSISTFLITLYTRNPLEKKIHEFRLKMNHEYEQRKQVKDTIALYKGHILQSAHSINGRIKNFTKNKEKAIGWMNIENVDDPNGNYYFRSFLYRILSFFAWIKILEDKLIFIDTTIASKNDILFVKLLKVMPQFFFDGDIVEGIKQTQIKFEKDIIYSDNFKLQYLWMIKNESVISFEEFKKSYKENYPKFKDLGRFMEGINLTEERFRIDRLFGFHLFIVELLNKFGYDYHKTSRKYLHEIVERHNKTSTFNNLMKHVFKKYKFGTFQLRTLYCTLKKYGS